MKSDQKILLNELRAINLDDPEIFSLFRSLCSDHTRRTEREFEFGISKPFRGKNRRQILASLHLNKHGELKKIDVGPPLKSETAQRRLLSSAKRWIKYQEGYVVLLRLMFSQLPLLGAFQWNETFRIRPLRVQSQIGKGLSWPPAHTLARFGESHLGPPYPFILEVAVANSSNQSLAQSHGMKLLNQCEALLTVLLLPRLTSGRRKEKQWTSIWNGTDLSYHLLNGGFDIGENGLQPSFAEYGAPPITVFKGTDYYNHLWGQDKEVYLPPNLSFLLKQYDSLSKPVRAAFNRACHWFSLGIESRQSSEIALVAFSTAVECLLPRAGGAKCSTCKKPLGKGPTYYFKRHLEKYAPVTEPLLKQREGAYDVRSALVHGKSVEAVDLDWLSPLANSDDQMELMELLARRSLVNWLSDPNRTDPTKPDPEE